MGTDNNVNITSSQLFIKEDTDKNNNDVNKPVFTIPLWENAYLSAFSKATGIAFDNQVCKSPETMPVEARSLVYSENGKVRAAIYKNGRRIEDTYVMPDITDVSVANDRVVFVTFADGTKEKAVLAADDQFSLEQGISICITKKLLSMKTEDNGSSVYNKIVEKGLKVVEDKKKKAEAEKQEKQVKSNRIKKLKAKKARKANAAREAQIEIQKEAYLRAMREFNSTSDCVAAE